MASRMKFRPQSACRAVFEWATIECMSWSIPLLGIPGLRCARHMSHQLLAAAGFPLWHVLLHLLNRHRLWCCHQSQSHQRKPARRRVHDGGGVFSNGVSWLEWIMFKTWCDMITGWLNQIKKKSTDNSLWHSVTFTLKDGWSTDNWLTWVRLQETQVSSKWHSNQFCFWPCDDNHLT